MPDIIDTFISPLLVLIIGGLAVLLIIQPVGAMLTNGIFTVLTFVYEKLGVVGGYILSAGFLPLVSVGLHQALTPIHALLNDPEGATKGINYLLPILMMAGGGQVGAGIALYLRTKNKKLKGYIRDSVPVGILGIGEPMMYAVPLPLGRSFLTAALVQALAARRRPCSIWAPFPREYPGCSAFSLSSRGSRWALWYPSRSLMRAAFY